MVFVRDQSGRVLPVATCGPESGRPGEISSSDGQPLVRQRFRDSGAGKRLDYSSTTSTSNRSLPSMPAPFRFPNIPATTEIDDGINEA